MVWMLEGDEEIAAIRELNASPDRVVAIVAAAVLESRLDAAIKARMKANTAIMGEFFRSSGPVGSFGAKIDLGFLLGIYGIEIYKDLKNIKDIRNEFAHRVQTRDFSSQRVNALSKNLTTPERHDADHSPGVWMNFNVKAFAELPLSARGRYVVAIQMLTVMLGFEAKSPSASAATPRF